MNKDYLEIYLDLACERQLIWYKKETNQPKPWTDNEIFRKYFFTNVFRDQDKVSQYIINNICSKDDPQYWGFMMLYRFIGRIEIFKELEQFEYDYDAIKKYLLAKEKRNERIVTGAYIVNSAGTMRKMEYIFWIIEKIAEDINGDWSEYGCHYNNNIQSSTEFFKAYPGIAGFMAYEYATDLTYCKWGIPQAEDRFIWANLGPGCNRGLNIVKGQPIDTNNKKEYLQDFKYIRDRWIEKFSGIKYNALPGLVRHRLRTPSMRDIEHWLCEFSKYAKYCSNPRSKHRKYQGV